jgi:sulfite reductase beta subunit-like hemoprotein
VRAGQRALDPDRRGHHERFDDLDTQYDIGDIDLHISGCINSCGHHHSGHIGILGVDKDGSEWYQVTVAGSDGSTLSGPARAGKVIGPSFAADEVPDVVEAADRGLSRDRRQPASTSSTPRAGLARNPSARGRCRAPRHRHRPRD